LSVLVAVVNVWLMFIAGASARLLQIYVTASVWCNVAIISCCN